MIYCFVKIIRHDKHRLINIGKQNITRSSARYKRSFEPVWPSRDFPSKARFVASRGFGFAPVPEFSVPGDPVIPAGQYFAAPVADPAHRVPYSRVPTVPRALLSAVLLPLLLTSLSSCYICIPLRRLFPPADCVRLYSKWTRIFVVAYHAVTAYRTRNIRVPPSRVASRRGRLPIRDGDDIWRQSVDPP